MAIVVRWLPKVWRNEALKQNILELLDMMKVCLHSWMHICIQTTKNIFWRIWDAVRVAIVFMWLHKVWRSGVFTFWITAPFGMSRSCCHIVAKLLHWCRSMGGVLRLTACSQHLGYRDVMTAHHVLNSRLLETICILFIYSYIRGFGAREIIKANKHNFIGFHLCLHLDLFKNSS